MGKTNLKKRIIALLIASAMLFLPISARASSQNYYASRSIENFFERNNDGTMTFEKEGALKCGYDKDYVSFVEENVKVINYYVATNQASLSDDFSISLYVNKSYEDKHLLKAKAKGKSKVEIWATGMVLIYMNTAEVNDLYKVIAVMKKTYTLIGIIGKLTVAQPIISKACQISSRAGAIQITSYKVQIRQAKKNGTGIIMYAAPLPDGIGMSVSFGAQ